MQTIEEYKAYTQQLEGEVSKWHHAYNALVIERNALVRKILETEKSVEVKDHANGYECVMILRDSYKAFSDELEELRKHDVEWDMAKARIKELEQKLNQKENQDAHRNNNDGRQENCKRKFTIGGGKD